MPLGRRLLLALCVAGAFGASVTLLGGGGCGTDAVGIDACLAIENKRCDLSAACVADFDVVFCKDYYRDQCLHGIENVASNPSEASIDACLAALDQVASCQASAVEKMSECGDGNLLIPGALDQSPCSVIVQHVQDLVACNFVANPDGGAPTSTASAGGAGGQGGTGGTGGAGGGAGGGPASSSSSSSSASAGGAGGTGGTAGGAGGTGGV